jgi:peptidoglycan/xylan/chitin deacetylase (PgdA/CDA1 family)
MTASAEPAGQSPAPAMPAPPAKLMQGITYKSCDVDGKFIALTFDDGPHADNSPRLLDILRQSDAKATFFVLGSNAAKYPELLKRMQAEGHEIGNHSWSHPHLLSLGFPEIKTELENTSKAVADATGQSPKAFRPPFIDTNPTLENWINKELGMKSILLSVDSLDWKDKDAALARQHVLEGAAPGAIVLMHERASTADALSGILDELKAQGYQFVTVSELIALDRKGKSAGR